MVWSFPLFSKTFHLTSSGKHENPFKRVWFWKEDRFRKQKPGMNRHWNENPKTKKKKEVKSDSQPCGANCEVQHYNKQLVKCIAASVWPKYRLIDVFMGWSSKLIPLGLLLCFHHWIPLRESWNRKLAASQKGVYTAGKKAENHSTECKLTITPFGQMPKGTSWAIRDPY